MTFPSGISPSTTAQVVHSAGRRFIVSPVPESRLRYEQFFGATSANTSFGDEASPGKKVFSQIHQKSIKCCNRCQGRFEFKQNRKYIGPNRVI